MEPWHELQHSIIQIDFIQAGISEQTSMKTTINMENTQKKTQKHKNTTHNFHGDFQSRGNTWHERTWRFQSRLNPKNTQTKHKDLHAMTDYKNFMTIDRARIEQLNPWRLF
jgi:dipeptidase